MRSAHIRFTFDLWRRVVWLACALLATVVGSASAQPTRQSLPVGSVHSGVLPLGTAQLPLPAGQWTVAGVGQQGVTVPAIGAYGTIQNTILFQIKNNRIVAVLEANANSIPVNDGWGRTKSCAAGGQPHLLTRYKSGWETGCQFVVVTAFGSASSGPAAWDRARAFAEQKSLTMADTWITAGFRASDRQDLIDARFHFDPTLFSGAPVPPGLDWSAEAVKADPQRDAAMRATAEWAKGYDLLIERGLRNQLGRSVGARPVPMPHIAAYTQSNPTIDAKLAELDRMFRDGRLNQDSYLAQSKLVLSEAPVVTPPTNLLSNAVRKNISFRSFGTFVDYAIAYVVTANNAISTGIALTINSTDSFWFVLNDQYWDDYYARLNTHDSERIIDFIYIGGGVKA